MDTTKKLENKLWNKNFFLLWQGQLVSVLGDVLYIMALDFWILEMTGSKSLMGLLSAITMMPRIILGPFAGVFIDKWDRKKVIVLTDLIRGIVVTFVGIAGVIGFIQVWMVFVVGIINGLCSAFFNPAINSSKPDIVPEDKLIKANSVTSLAQAGIDLIGYAAGGVLYVLIGAPYMFLFNGLSYLFSAFTEMFITIPKLKREEKEITFKEDFKIGLNFIKDF
ncbi:MAG: MFS transporter, partial [Paraclostridium sp.]